MSERSENPDEFNAPRTRLMTTKGKEYRLERLKSIYRSSKRCWRTHLNSLASLIITENDVQLLKLQCFKLEKKTTDLTKDYEELEKELSSEEEKIALDDEFDSLTKENVDLLRMINNRVRELEMVIDRSEKSSTSKLSTTGSRRSCTSSSYKSSNAKSSRHPSDRSSGRHSKKHESSSSSSSRYERQLNLQGKVAVLQSKLDLTSERHNFESKAQAKLEEIHKQRLELKLSEERSKKDMKNYEDRYDTVEDPVRAEAELNLCHNFPSGESSEYRSSNDFSDRLPQENVSKELLKKFIIDQSHRYNDRKEPYDERDVHTDVKGLPKPSRSKDNIKLTWDESERASSEVSPSTKSSLVERQLVEIVKILAENQRCSDLPSPEP